LFELPRWVPYRLQWNDKREKFDKVPHTGKHGLSTKDPSHWMTYAEAQAVVAGADGLHGVGLVFTGGIDEGEWRLAGIDADDVDFEAFKLPFDTYTELSPSGTGLRAFVWVPIAWAAKFRDTPDLEPGDCKHVEIYLGTAPRFLTVTFEAINAAPIAYLDNLSPWKLKHYEPDRPLILPESMGEVLNIGDYTRERELLEVATGNCEGEDRSSRVHKLLWTMFDLGASPDDVLATIAANPHLTEYMLDHRHHDGASAMKFAGEEISRAYAKSVPGMVLALKPKTDPAAPGDDKPDRYRLPRIDERVKRPRKPRFAIGRQFLKESTTMIVGDTGAGKTTLAVYTAVCKAHALRDPNFLWNGMPIYDPRPQQYIAGEDADGVEDMVIGLCKELDIPLEGLPLHVSDGAFDFSLPTEVAKLKAACAADFALYGKMPDWTVDTLSRNAGTLEENSATDMRVLLVRLEELSGDGSTSVLHHTGVDPKAQDRERGSSVLRKDPTANYTCRKDGELFHLECQTQRGAKKPERVAMQFKEVEVGTDYDDDGNVIGPRMTYILLPVGKAHRAMLTDAFYKANPELAERGRRQYLRDLLARIMNHPGESQRSLAELCGIEQPRIRRTLELLRNAGFVIGGAKGDKQKLQLTQAGVEALRELDIDVAVELKAAGQDARIFAREKPLTPGIVAASLGKKGAPKS
jgi:hypothetical protein